ncbi:hypothetical protein MIR68_009486 [Amoeboaphelidium protococcarum]|nr:hypothetical protein MIR68_009486 [Amoeboaphelidium protococcarum]KAI3646557.1 hypothetical protein MP228_009485 [Amoeboaphelidium protococcarum]
MMSSESPKKSGGLGASGAILGGTVAVGTGVAYYLSQQQPLKVDETQNVLVIDKTGDVVPKSELAAWDPSKLTVVFVLGGPGSGKGTQCANIVRDYGFIHLSAGDLLRAERARPGSKYGELIETYIREGQIVPMEITISLLEQAMKESGGQKFLIDGFPRKMDQALKFEEQICPSSLVLYFDCSEGTMLKRLLKRGETSGRSDDNIESIKKRFKTFVETSLPVVQHYDQLHKVHKVNCEDTIDRVYEKVRGALNKIN